MKDECDRCDRSNIFNKLELLQKAELSMKTAILTPLRAELFILREALENQGFLKRKFYLEAIEIVEFQEIDLLLALGGHGKTQFGIQSQYIFARLPQIEILVCAGAAGALCSTVQVGDLVVATETVEHDYNLQFVNRPLPRFTGDSETIDVLQKIQLETESDFSVYFDAVASGDEDVVTPARRQELAKLTGCMVVAWEGAGGARACKFNQKRYIELRAVTDTADHTAIEDFKRNLTTAMSNLANFVIQWQTTSFTTK